MGNAVRKCGECVACCVYLKINTPELKKPGFTHCPHLRLTQPIEKNVMQLSSFNGGNCTAHGGPERPHVCGSYKCLWLLGHGNDEDRPDKSGVIIDTTHNIKNGIQVKQLWEGAVDEPKARAAIRRMVDSTGCAALITSFYETRLYEVIV